MSRAATQWSVIIQRDLSIRLKGGAGKGARAGTNALTLLSSPINVYVLEALAARPRSLVDLRRAAGSPAHTTLRGYLRTLTELGILERNRQDGFAGAVEYALVDPGRELLNVTATLRNWLALAPDGALSLGSGAAKSAIGALVEGWGTSILRVLAAEPRSLTELDALIAGLSYPSLERRLAAMRLAGQAKRQSGNASGSPYAVTDWSRRSIAPLAAAARWERQHLREQTPPITPNDAEAAFLLSVPLLSLPAELNGSCRLAVEFPPHRLAGVVADVEAGRVVSCVSRLEADAGGWASGSAGDWLRAVMDQDSRQLEIGGDCHLVEAVVDGLRQALFRSRPRS